MEHILKAVRKSCGKCLQRIPSGGGHWKKGMALSCVCLLLLASGCGREEEAPLKPPFVKTQRAGGVEQQSVGVYAGSVKARHEAKLSFQAGGQILSRNVQMGSRVQAGDVLMIINPRDVLQQANQGDAQVASARAQMDLAQANLLRYTQLYQEEAVPAAVLDQYRTNYDAAFAAYQSALAQAAQAHNSLGYTELRAPAEGVISAVNAEEGQVVPAGQAVLVLSRTDELEVEIDVPENRLDAVPVGHHVTVNFWAIPGNVEGIVREVSPMADPVSRTYRVRVSLPAPPEGMELGMTASVEVPEDGMAGAKDSVVLPLAAIYQSGDIPQVWVVQDHTVHLQPVQVSVMNKDEVAVQGVEREALVVIAGIHKLREGQQVRTEEDEP